MDERKGDDVAFFSRFFAANSILLREMPRPARVAVLVLFAASLADGVPMPFFALWAHREAGIPVAAIGLLLGCYAGGELLATPFVGGIADRIGRRPVLLASTAGVGIGFLLLYLARGVPAAAISLILIGVFESVLHPTAFAVIADAMPAAKVRNGFAPARAASSVGRVAGPAAGALLVRWSLGLVFVGSAVSLLVGTLAVAAFLPETRTANSASEDDDDDLMAITAVFRDRKLAGLLVPVAVIEVASSWIETVLPLHATDTAILTPTGVGFLFAYAGLLAVLFQMPITQAIAKVPAFSVVTISGGCMVLAFASLLVSPALVFLILAVTLLELAQILFGPLVQTIVTELAPDGARATYMAAFSTVNDLKDTAGPAIGMYLYAVLAGLPWLVGMPVALVAAIVLARAARRHEAASVA